MIEKDLEEVLRYVEGYLESAAESEDESGVLMSAKPLLADVRAALNIRKDRSEILYKSAAWMMCGSAVINCVAAYKNGNWLAAYFAMTTAWFSLLVAYPPKTR